MLEVANMLKGEHKQIHSGRYAGQWCTLERRRAREGWTVTLDGSYNTAIVKDAEFGPDEEPAESAELTDEQEQAARTIVRSRMVLCKDYENLFRAALRFTASLYGKKSSYYLAQERKYLAEPERMLSAHAGVMNAKSTRCQTLRALADSVIAQAELPMQPCGMFRGEDYRVDWRKAWRKWQPTTEEIRK